MVISLTFQTRPITNSRLYLRSLMQTDAQKHIQGAYKLTRTRAHTGKIGQQDLSHLRRWEMERKRERELYLSCCRHPAKSIRKFASSIFRNERYHTPNAHTRTDSPSLWHTHTHTHTHSHSLAAQWFPAELWSNQHGQLYLHTHTQTVAGCWQSALKWIVLIRWGCRLVSIFSQRHAAAAWRCLK